MKKARAKDSVNREYFETLYHTFLKTGMNERRAYFAAKRAVQKKDAEPLHHLFEQVKNRVPVGVGTGED